MSKGGKPPKPPDYVAAAREQGRLNQESARIGAQLNRVNQQGPYGSVIYTRDPSNPDQYTQTTTLSPEQQMLYDQRTGMAGDSGGYLRQQLAQGIDYSSLPDRVSGVDPRQYQSTIDAPASRYSDIDTSNLPDFYRPESAEFQSAVDFSGAPTLPGQNDFSAERQRVEDSLYGRATTRLDPEFDQREEAMRSQLVAQGIREGSEAWNNARRDFENTRQDAYAGARNDAIQAGGAEQSRLFADALRARQQGVGETVTQGQFVNNAANLENIYGLAGRSQTAAERGQQFGENAAVAQFGNQSVNERLANELAVGGFYNDAQGAEFGQDVINANLGNTARDAGINEQLLPRQQLMSEYLSLYGGLPQGPAAAQPMGVSGPNPADYMGAINQQYGADVDVYNADQARRAQLINSLLGVGKAAIGQWG